ncbi:MAG TPA: LytR family transcriptional regulator [Anaerolineae bacterium]|nr:LytR family transcriptional regulator [Anaerolineae bacterium]
MTQPMQHPTKSPSPAGKRLSSGLLGLLLVIFLASFLYASFLFFRTVRAILASSPQAERNPLLLVAKRDGAQPALTDMPQGQAPRPEAALPDGRPYQTPEIPIDSFWETQDPVNILLLGIDQRPGENGYFRTDTMILLHVNPKTGDVGMISFPRDLWVEAPGYWETRINSAHVIGDAKGYPGGGPALAKKTVEKLIGQPVDYYVRINFEGFRKLLEEIGCIEIDVPKLIDDPTFPDDNYGYDPLYIEPGHYCMDADLALKYARTRHVDSDFGRMERQQQVLMAIKDKILSTGGLPRLIVRAPALLNILSDSIQTDMPLSKMIALANMARNMELNNIRRLIIDVNMVEPAITDTGAWVLMPKMDRIQAAIHDFFATDNVETGQGQQAPPTATTPSDETSLPNLATPPQEVRIIILNGTNTPDLDKVLSDILISYGYNVVGVGMADRNDYAATQIIESSGHEGIVQRLADLLGVSDQDIRPGAADQLQADIVIILGANFSMPP